MSARDVRNGSRTARRGFTLVEIVIALSLMLVLGYTVTTSLQVARRSNTTVDRVAAEDRALRASADSLLDDLRSTNAAHVVITTIAGQNSQLRVQVPIEVGGAIQWGVHERALGPTAAQQDRANWSVRYMVQNVALGGGAFDRELRRQILDDTLAVRVEEVLMHGLRTGADVPPGFRVVQIGDVWEVTLSLEGALAGRAGMRTVFHVRSRN